MRAVVCGAGIAGLALAQRLDATGWDVVVLERADGPRGQGYMIDFFGPGYDAAEAMGVLPRIRELGYQVREVAYLDEAGRRRARIDYGQFGRAVRGRLLSIMRPDLERALREHLSADVELRFGVSPRHVEQHPDGVRLTLDDGTVLDADLLVGADGIHSTVRSLVFGPESRYLRYLGFHTAAFVFDDPSVHAQVDGRFCLTDTIDRQMGCYGLRDGRVAVFAVHRTADPTRPDDARAAIRQEYATLGWLAPRALAACPSASEVYYDQVAQIELPQWHRNRVVLVGDACFAVSLLAGQGASLGIAGAFVLAEQLARAGSIEEGLTRYERMWRPVVTDRQRVARRGARWFLPESRWQLRARRVALRLARLPGLDRRLATSLTGKPTAAVMRLRATDG
ncbi:FAD-dependent monooxygenase [Micromonospora polyrhachis]|uniref:2-polyprenyl-6-methoxyphenol hydroxylase-like FAD-dependent oxidoreductase n=1 Tax=Micromonospora polyrhachis TaxID=1282883 RepID=A0A7W7SS77_9ACTN|nr:FAD-dependent monooxygenase [Micromonospora polyrhachis]MBB4959856.1 2-polyprenyl-6-methoxyphenol hydroxylase-like FAD-dependent oxidoreductase [Micromonospora polyrhachis]